MFDPGEIFGGWGANVFVEGRFRPAGVEDEPPGTVGDFVPLPGKFGLEAGTPIGGMLGRLTV